MSNLPEPRPAPAAPAPRPTRERAPAPADDDNRYRAVQARLAHLAASVDDLSTELEDLRKRMKRNAARTNDLAGAIERAELDRRFVYKTGEVANALHAVTARVRLLNVAAQDVVSVAHNAKDTHRKLYQDLDTIRSGRRERTPKPGFFDR
ncbi:conjugal transfer protein TraB [Embleya sp. NPDC020630]|uniref:conjugal transfer protein TraB n=1 Tax=Embleya sp. NPDC020630 TaxID=3363979 RepID=UPI0037B2ECCF